MKLNIFKKRDALISEIKELKKDLEAEQRKTNSISEDFQLEINNIRAHIMLEKFNDGYLELKEEYVRGFMSREYKINYVRLNKSTNSIEAILLGTFYENHMVTNYFSITNSNIINCSIEERKDCIKITIPYIQAFSLDHSAYVYHVSKNEKTSIKIQ